MFCYVWWSGNDPNQPNPNLIQDQEGHNENPDQNPNQYQYFDITRWWERNFEIFFEPNQLKMLEK